MAQKRLTQRTLDRLQSKVALPDRLSLDNWAKQIDQAQGQLEVESDSHTQHHDPQPMADTTLGDWDQFVTRARADLLSTSVKTRIQILNDQLSQLVKKRTPLSLSLLCHVSRILTAPSLNSCSRTCKSARRGQVADSYRTPLHRRSFQNRCTLCPFLLTLSRLRTNKD